MPLKTSLLISHVTETGTLCLELKNVADIWSIRAEFVFMMLANEDGPCLSEPEARVVVMDKRSADNDDVKAPRTRKSNDGVSATTCLQQASDGRNMMPKCT